MIGSARCQLCSGSEAKVIQNTGVKVRDAAIDLLKCRRCGLIYLWPPLNADDLETLYSEEYFVRWYSSNEKREAEKNYFRRLLAANDLGIGPGCDALDIGCGTGAFLEVGRENRWNMNGVEISVFASGYCRDKLGCNVHTGTVESAGYLESSFDVITAFDVLEHIGRLSPFLDNIVRILRRDGRFVVLVPNYDGLVFQIDRLIRRLKGAPLPNTPEHLTYFTRQSLHKLLAAHGLRPRSVTTIDANDQGDLFHLEGSALARARAWLNRMCYRMGKLTDRGDAILAVSDKVV